MKYIEGFNRNQIRIVTDTPDDMVDPNAEVRVMDAFVDALPLGDYGFRVDYEENGRPAYHLMRLMHIMGNEGLKSMLESWKRPALYFLSRIESLIAHLSALFFPTHLKTSVLLHRSESLFWSQNGPKVGGCWTDCRYGLL